MSPEKKAELLVCNCQRTMDIDGEKLARALGLMVEAVTVAELGNIAVDQPYFLILHLGIALRDRALAKAQRFDLGAL